MEWKVVTVITNISLSTAIYFHDVLHIIQVVNGIVTASIEVKLIHQLMLMREEVLYAIFLGLNKVYGALDRYRCL